MASTLKRKPGPALSGGEALQVAAGTTLKLVWYDPVVPSFWSLTSTSSLATIDTSGGIVLPENARNVMKPGDFVWARGNSASSPISNTGMMVVVTISAVTGSVDLSTATAISTNTD